MLNRRTTWASLGLLGLLYSVNGWCDAIGKVLLVTGEAVAKQKNDARTLQRGAVVYEDDLLNTGEKSSLQVRFDDGALLSLQSNTQMHVKEYRYNENNKSENSSILHLIKGGFKTLTGAIAKNNKEGYKVTSEIATMGVRGTYWGAVLGSFSGSPKMELVVSVFKGQGVWVQSPTQPSRVDIGPSNTFSNAIVSMGGEAKGTMTIPEGTFEKSASLQAATSTTTTTTSTTVTKSPEASTARVEKSEDKSVEKSAEKTIVEAKTEKTEKTVVAGSLSKEAASEVKPELARAPTVTRSTVTNKKGVTTTIEKITTVNASGTVTVTTNKTVTKAGDVVVAPMATATMRGETPAAVTYVVSSNNISAGSTSTTGTSVTTTSVQTIFYNTTSTISSNPFLMSTDQVSQFGTYMGGASMPRGALLLGTSTSGSDGVPMIMNDKSMKSASTMMVRNLAPAPVAGASTAGTSAATNAAGNSFYNYFLTNTGRPVFYGQWAATASNPARLIVGPGANPSTQDLAEDVYWFTAIPSTIATLPLQLTGVFEARIDPTLGKAGRFLIGRGTTGTLKEGRIKFAVDFNSGVITNQIFELKVQPFGATTASEVWSMAATTAIGAFEKENGRITTKFEIDKIQGTVGGQAFSGDVQGILTGDRGHDIVGGFAFKTDTKNVRGSFGAECQSGPCV